MKRPLLFVCIWLVVFVCAWTYFTDAPPYYEDFPIIEGAHITITGQIYQKEYSSYYGTNQINLYLQSIKIINSDTGQVSNLNPKYKIICELKGDYGDPELGKNIRVSGEWQFYEHASNPGEFDAAQYYATQNIPGKIKDCRMEAQGADYWKIREMLFDLRTFLKDRLCQALPKKDASILAKMLLGEKSSLDQETKELYQRNGIVHILSISGLHITMVGMGIYRLLRKCTCTAVQAAVIGTVILLLYGAMTGFSVSSVRAIGMYFIHMLGIILGRSYDLLTALGVLMAVMICENPRLTGHSGFLLSFGSVCAVGCLYPILPLQEVTARKTAVPPPLPVRFLLKRCGGLIQGLWLSASISIFTLPITLYYFFEVPVYSAFVNLLILPFMGPVMAIGFVLMAVPDISPLAWLEHSILSGYERVCLLFEELPGHTWVAGRPEIWQIAVYYAGLFLIIWLCSGKRSDTVKSRGNMRRNRKCAGNDRENSEDSRNIMENCRIKVRISSFIKRSKWWSCGIVVLVLVLGTDFHGEDTISFLDVGQGDCIVLMTQTGKTYLFDGGSSSEKTVGEDIILPFLKCHGVSSVDGVFISHPDKDHMNGILELLEQDMVEIEKIYLPDVQEDQKTDFEELLDAADGQQVIYYSAGDYLREGDLKLTCLHPTEDFAGDTNTYSGCFLVENAGLRVLLTGDVEAAGETMLTAQLKERAIGKVQVLKVAHHGSRYSTGEEFLEVLDADLAVISCGEDNSYGHPHQDTIMRLEQADIPYCITWERGCVTVTREGYCFFND